MITSTRRRQRVVLICITLICMSSPSHCNINCCHRTSPATTKTDWFSGSRSSAPFALTWYSFSLMMCAVTEPSLCPLLKVTWSDDKSLSPHLSSINPPVRIYTATLLHAWPIDRFTSHLPHFQNTQNPCDPSPHPIPIFIQTPPWLWCSYHLMWILRVVGKWKVNK